MAQYTHLPIYKTSYDLLYRVMHATKQFPREYKYTLGQEMKQEAMGLILHIYRANSYRDRAAHISSLLERVQSPGRSSTTAPKATRSMNPSPVPAPPSSLPRPWGGVAMRWSLIRATAT